MNAYLATRERPCGSNSPFYLQFLIMKKVLLTVSAFALAFAFSTVQAQNAEKKETKSCCSASAGKPACCSSSASAGKSSGGSCHDSKSSASTGGDHKTRYAAQGDEKRSKRGNGKKEESATPNR